MRDPFGIGSVPNDSKICENEEMVPGMGLEPMAFGFPWQRSGDQNPMSPTLYQLSHPGLRLPIGS